MNANNSYTNWSIVNWQFKAQPVQMMISGDKQYTYPSSWWSFDVPPAVHSFSLQHSTVPVYLRWFHKAFGAIQLKLTNYSKQKICVSVDFVFIKVTVLEYFIFFTVVWMLSPECKHSVWQHWCFNLEHHWFEQHLLSAAGLILCRVVITHLDTHMEELAVARDL